MSLGCVVPKEKKRKCQNRILKVWVIHERQNTVLYPMSHFFLKSWNIRFASSQSILHVCKEFSTWNEIQGCHVLEYWPQLQRAEQCNSSVSTPAIWLTHCHAWCQVLLYAADSSFQWTNETCIRGMWYKIALVCVQVEMSSILLSITELLITLQQAKRKQMQSVWKCMLLSHNADFW